jgi:recombination protein RecA
MAKKKSEETKNEQMDSLAEDVMAVVNKKFKDIPNSLVYMSNANLVTDWVSTGSSILDLAISNRPNGGLGYGIICEIFGPSASSKSLIAAHVLANTQKQGGLAVLFDTENAVGMLDFYRSFGLDVERAIYSDKLRALEEIFTTIAIIIERQIAAGEDKPVTIVVDSVMGATTLAELEADYAKEGWATGKSIILSQAMRKITSLMVGRKILIIFINQVRSKLGVQFGDNTTTSGGFAIGFHSSVRLKTKLEQKLYYPNTKDEYGNTVKVTVIKNRLGPPGRSAKFDITYESGIDDMSSWLEALKDFGFLKQSGAWYSYESVDRETGEQKIHKFLAKDFKKLVNEVPGMRETIYDQICSAYIMKYNIGDDFDTDSIIREDVVHDED